MIEIKRPIADAPKFFAEFGPRLHAEYGSTYTIDCRDPQKGENFLRIDAWLRRGWTEGLDLTLLWRGENELEVKIDHGSQFEDYVFGFFVIPFFLLGLGFAVWVGVTTDWIPRDPEAEELFIAILAVPTLIVAGLSGLVGIYLSRAVASLFFKRDDQLIASVEQWVRSP